MGMTTQKPMNNTFFHADYSQNHKKYDEYLCTFIACAPTARRCEMSRYEILAQFLGNACKGMVTKELKCLSCLMCILLLIFSQKISCTFCLPMHGHA